MDDLRKEIDFRFDLIEAKIDGVKKDLDAKIEKLGLQLIVRLGGMMAIAIGVMTALMKLI